MRKSTIVLDTYLANKSFYKLNGVPEIDARKGTNKIKQHAFRKKLHQVQTDTVEDRNSSVPSFKVAMKTARDDLSSL